MYSSKEVANYVVNFTIEENNCVTNLKLQKMLYFIQGFSYAKMSKRFIDDEF